MNHINGTLYWILSVYEYEMFSSLEVGVETYMLNLHPHPHGWGTDWSNRQGHLEGQALLQQPAQKVRKRDFTIKFN